MEKLHPDFSQSCSPSHQSRGQWVSLHCTLKYDEICCKNDHIQLEKAIKAALFYIICTFFFTNQSVMRCVLPDICPHTHSDMCCNKSGFSLASRSVTVNMLKQLPSLSVFTHQTTSEHCSVGYIYTPLFTGPTLHTPTSSGSPSPHPQSLPVSHFSLSLINSCCRSSATFYTAMILTQ